MWQTHHEFDHSPKGFPHGFSPGAVYPMGIHCIPPLSGLCRFSQAWIYLDAGYGKVMGEWNWSTEVPALAVL
jgi:hypothetical protein